MKNLIIPAALLVILLTLPALSQQSSSVSFPTNSQPYNLLILGDSITWGQGLKKEHKAWFQVKVWLEKQLRRPVVERVEAHSGAVIDSGPPRAVQTPDDHEVNLGFPSINEQVDTALRFYGDGTRVDLVLISGCGNDVGTQSFLNAESSEALHRMTEQKCEPLMETLLRKVTSSFPNAQVIVVGYYPFFSENTPNDFVTRSLARSLINTTNPAVAQESSKQLFERLASNSREWFKASDKAIDNAVRKINEELSTGIRNPAKQGDAGVGTQRVAFAKVEFPPEYSFATKQTRLWGFNRSPFRLMLVFLSLGRIELPTNDEVRRQRSASCDVFYKATTNETVDQKRQRRNRRLLCRYASIGHPNRKGATLYADAIVEVLKEKFR